MFGGTTSAGGGVLGAIEGDISSIFGSLTTAANNTINQQLNPTPTFGTGSVLLIAAVIIGVILIVR